MRLSTSAVRFAERVIAWQKTAGRHDLPWQHQGVYATWISEVMLQQTQVLKVIPYYDNFMRRFPDLKALQSASLEEVLSAWSGLGYYRRAHHLHQAAQKIAQFGWPETLEAWMSLPGIGRSTAGAIYSLGQGKRAPLCDGNVMRLFSRHAGADLSLLREAEKWSLAWERLPMHDFAIYNQGLMDLGATICRPHMPDCAACPLRIDCRWQGDVKTSAPKPKMTIELQCAIDVRDGKIALQKRPKTGIWPELWFLPETRNHEHLLDRITHQLTHRILHIELYESRCDDKEVTHIDLASLRTIPRPKVLDKICTLLKIT